MIHDTIPPSPPSPLSLLTPSPPPSFLPNSLPPPSHPRRTTRILTPSNQLTNNDGLAPISCLSAALSDFCSAAIHCQEERSSRRATSSNDHTTAFISLFAPMRDSHDLIPLDTLSNHGLTLVDEVLTALTNGSVEPEVDLDDEPSWGKAMASPECEYWVARSREEIKSLEDLNVFVLVPRTYSPPRILPHAPPCHRDVGLGPLAI